MLSVAVRFLIKMCKRRFEKRSPGDFFAIGLGNVLARISNKTDRPLVAQDPERQWKDLLAARAPIYESLATIVIATDNKKPYEVARELMSRMGLARE